MSLAAPAPPPFKVMIASGLLDRCDGVGKGRIRESVATENTGAHGGRAEGNTAALLFRLSCPFLLCSTTSATSQAVRVAVERERETRRSNLYIKTIFRWTLDHRIEEVKKGRLV